MILHFIIKIPKIARYHECGFQVNQDIPSNFFQVNQDIP